MRRGATDPVSGMKVDRHKAVTMDFVSETHYFCSDHCLHAFEVDAAPYLGRAPVEHAHASKRPG